MHYCEIDPSAELRPFIRCYWTLSGRFVGDPQPQRVFPDGSMELIFHFADPFRHQGQRQKGALLAGQIWSPITLEPSPDCDVLGVRFRSGGAAAFLRFPQQEVAGQILPLADIWPRGGQRLYEQIGNAPGRISTLERILISMRPSSAMPERTLSSRQYRRRFESAVGIPPKLLQRIYRFQRVLPMIGRIPMSQAALAAGYYDQAHLIRDFRQFAGITPSQWLRGRHDVLFFQDILEAEAIASSL